MKLAQAFLAGFQGRPDGIVARTETAGEPLRLDALLRHAALIARLLPEPRPDSEVAFAFGHDRAAFAAALLATWSRGHVAAVPEDSTRENVAGLLTRAENVAFLHDTGVGRGHFVPELLARTPPEEALAPRELDPERVLLAAFRRRISGEMRCAAWTAMELVRETQDLARRMALAPGTTVVSPFAPTSVPDLLAGLLVPLQVGAAFGARTPTAGAALLDCVRAWQARAVLVTPFHARALASAPAGALRPLAELYCVDETLDARHASLLVERHGVRVVPLRGLPLDEDEPEIRVDLRAALCSVEGVTDAAAGTLPPGTGGGTHVLVAAAAPEAQEAELRELVRRRTPAGITSALRCFRALPRDANGRLSDPRLFLAFGYGRDGRPRTRELAWTPVETGEPGSATRRFRTRIPESYLFFEGHFTTYPVLAGAAQVRELVLPCVRSLGLALGALRRLSSVKFLARIAPGDEVDVLVHLPSGVPTNGSVDVRYEIRSGDRRCSVGRAEFLPPVPENWS